MCMKKNDIIQKIKKGDTLMLLYISGGLILLTACIIGVWFFYPDTKGTDSLVDDQQKTYQEDTTLHEGTCEFRRLLDGICVTSQEETHGPLVGVMIENHIDAQPLSGIDDARVVYEASVEGGITRLLALYTLDSDVSKVGPVRSARPYYLDWISEYSDAMYMHVGGSPEALQKIQTFGIFDMDEFGRGWYFWRDKNRYAPHNAYTSSELWQKAYERYAPESTTTTFASWKFAEKEPCVVTTSTSQAENNICASYIDISFRGGQYGADWYYDSEKGVYEREQFGRPHRDVLGNQITADTVIVQYVSGRAIDAVGRLSVDTIGTGDAVVFAKGHVTEGIWTKEKRTDRTHFVDLDGNSIYLAPGKIWVTVVTQAGEVAWES